MTWMKSRHNRGRLAYGALYSIAADESPSIEDLQALSPGDLVTVLKALAAGEVQR